MNALQFLQTALFLLVGVVVFGMAVFAAYVAFILIRTIFRNEQKGSTTRKDGRKNE